MSDSATTLPRSADESSRLRERPPSQRGGSSGTAEPLHELDGPHPDFDADTDRHAQPDPGDAGPDTDAPVDQLGRVPFLRPDPDRRPGWRAAASNSAVTIATGGLTPAQSDFWGRAGKLAVILGPTTVLTGFLYYVGHVSTRAFYAYFGVSLSALDIPTSTLLLRSVDELFDPLSVVVLLSFAAFVLHHVLVAAVRRQPPARARVLALTFASAALALVAIGIAGLLGQLRSMLTPCALGLSGVALEYACWLAARTTADDSTLGSLVRAGVSLRRGLVAALILVAVLWGATAVAAARGTARAQAVEISLPLMSQAVVYSRTDLRLTGRGIKVTQLAGTPGDLRYRYNGLRPLLHTDDTWLLLPVGWRSDNGSTAIMLADAPGEVRVDLAR